MKKSLIEKIVISSFVASTVLTIGGITLGSFLSYNAYLNEIYENRLENTTTLESITVSLNEGVKYFNNGKADPKKSDFVVTAKYKIGKSRQYEEILTENRFELFVPEDFAFNGGEFKITFEDKEVKLKYSLIDVVLFSLTVIRNPYLVCYPEGSIFKKEGLILQGEYNDGSLIEIKEDDIEIETSSPLVIGQESVTVSCSLNEKKVTTEIPVKVMTKETFTNGKVVSMSFESEPYVYSGETLSQVKNLIIKATFDSGNYLTMEPSNYTITNKDEIAVFGKNACLNLIPNDDPLVKREVPVKVINQKDSTSATVVGGNTTTIRSYVCESGQLVEDKNLTVAGNFTDSINNNENASITYSIDSATKNKSDLYLTVNNPYIKYENNMYIAQSMQLNTMFDLYVNGNLKAINYSSCTPGDISSSNYQEVSQVYTRIKIANVLLNSGNNEVKLIVKANTKNLLDHENSIIKSINVASIDSEYTSTETKMDLNQYFTICQDKNIDPKITSTTLKTWMSATSSERRHSFVQDATSDGKYIYAVFASNNNYYATVAKIDLSNNSIISTSDSFAISNVDSGVWNDDQDIGNICVGEDKIFITKNSGIVELKSNDLSIVSEKSELINLPSTETSGISDIYYANEQYFVRAKNGKVYTLDKNYNLTTNPTFDMVSASDKKFQSLNGNKDYIYAVFNKDKYDGAEVLISDYTGQKKIRKSLEGVFKAYEDKVGANVNIQNIVEANGDLYAFVYSVDHGGSFFFKLGFDYSPEDSISLNYGEFFQETESINYTVKNNKEWFVVTKTIDDKKITFNTIQSAVTVDDKVYLSVNDGNNYRSVVVEYSVSDQKIIRTSDIAFIGDSASWNPENGCMFYEQGKFYLARSNGNFEIIDEETFKVVESDQKLFTLPSGVSQTIFNVTFNQQTERYMVTLSNGDSYFYDSLKRRIESINKINVNESGLVNQSTFTNGDYIYVVHGKDNYDGCKISLYDWNGKKLGTETIEKVFASKTDLAESSYNVQTIIECNGKLYISIFSWGRGHSFLSEISYN